MHVTVLCAVLQGRGGGERVLQVFEEQLPQAMNAQPFAQLLAIQSVKRIIQDSDGYQPFLVAPENGYRALVREGVKLMEQPAASAVDAVDMVLRDIGQKVSILLSDLFLAIHLLRLSPLKPVRILYLVAVNSTQ
jgi:Dynamin central region